MFNRLIVRLVNWLIGSLVGGSGLVEGFGLVGGFGLVANLDKLQNQVLFKDQAWLKGLVVNFGVNSRKL